VGGQLVEDHEVARPERRGEHLLDAERMAHSCAGVVRIALAAQEHESPLRRERTCACCPEVEGP
jgi:hypothetical protein